jgi:small-conductance mechanosensitive channel
VFKFIDPYLKVVVFHIGKYDITVENIVNLIFIYFGTLLVLYLIRYYLAYRGKKSTFDKKRNHSIYLFIKYFLWVFSIILMIKSTGLDITYFLAGSAALFVGIGLGVQDIFKDIVSGIFMLTEGTIRIDDILEIDGNVGKVTDIKLRTSDFLTRNGSTVVVPNHKFITEKVVNWSHNLTPTRFEVVVGVSYNANEKKVKDILTEIARQHPEIITSKKDLKPFVRINDFGDSAVIYSLYFWSSNMFNIEDTKSDIRFDIREAFRRDHIEIPFPQRVLHNFVPNKGIEDN